MSMTRRSFLQLISAAAAATAVDLRTLIPESPNAPAIAPTVDWNQWNSLAVRLVNGIPEWSVNGVVVNPFPELVKRVSQIVRPGGLPGAAGGAVRFSMDAVECRYREKYDSIRKGRYALVDGLLDRPVVCRVPSEA